MLEKLVESYYYFINDSSDPRVKNWIGFSNPLMELSVIALYLLCVYAFLPFYMRSRKPYELYMVLYYYNQFQIVANALIAYKMATSGWTTTYSLGCHPIKYSQDEESLRMLKWCYYLFILKHIDLFETFFFMLRKKDKQVSALHVYHHVSTCCLGWLGIKFVAGGMATFGPMLNCCVHVFMYAYYLSTRLGMEWRSLTQKWKSKLTLLQIIQLVLILIHATGMWHPKCKKEQYLAIIYLSNIILLFFLFTNFYKKNYSVKPKSE